MVAVGRDLRAIAALQQRLVDAQQSMERDYCAPASRRDTLSAPLPDGLRGGADRRCLDPEGGGGQSGGDPTARRSRRAAWWVGSSPMASMRKAPKPSRPCSPTSVRRAGPTTSAHGWPTVAATFVVVGVPVPPGECLTVSGPPFPGRGRRIAGSRAEDEIQAPQRRGECARRLRRHRPGRAHPRRQFRFRRFGAAGDRGAGTGRIARSLARATRRRPQRADRQSAPARRRSAVRDDACAASTVSTAEVEISAVSVPDGEQPCLGFTIRNVGRRLHAEPGSAASCRARSSS